MTWTYKSDYTTTRDKVRLLCGDTDQTDPLLTDEEIAQLAVSGINATYTAALACDAIGAKFARRATSRVDDISVNWSDVAEQFYRRADRLRREAAFVAVPLAGGVSEDRKETLEDDDDIIVPSFKVGMLDNPNVDEVDDEEEE